MNAIRLIGTDDTPGVVLDKEAGKFELSGRSMPEDVVAFFQIGLKIIKILQIQKPFSILN